MGSDPIYSSPEKMGSDPIYLRIPLVEAELVADRASQSDPALAWLWSLLEQVRDPEIPVLSVRELGVLRALESTASGLRVVITPTWSGCPAMHTIEQDIRAVLEAAGVASVTVSTRFAPAWTTDWITPGARESLRRYGVAPPAMTSPDAGAADPAPACPQCGSTATRCISEFGSTACKSLWQCRDCSESFDAFKRL